MDLQQRIINKEQLWHASHSEVQSRIKQIESSGAQSPAGRVDFLIDATMLVPDSFSREKHSMAWRDWSHRVRSYVGTAWPKLWNMMERAEQRAIIVTDTNEGIDVSLVEALKYLPIARITGQAHIILRQDDTANGFDV